MNSNNKFRLPLKKVPFLLNTKLIIKLYSKIYYRSISQSFSKFTKNIKRLIAIALSTIIISSGWLLGLQSYAYNAESVVPSHILYNLRRNIELNKLEKIDQSENRSSFYLLLSERRLNEANYIIWNKQDKLWFLLITPTFANDIEVKLWDDNTIWSLLIESNDFQSLAIEEVNSIKDVKQLDLMFIKLQETIVKQNITIEKINQATKNTETKEVIKQIKNTTISNIKDIKTLSKIIESVDPKQEYHVEVKPQRILAQWRKNPRMEEVRSLSKLHSIKKGNPKEYKKERKQIKKLIKENRFKELENKRKTINKKRLQWKQKHLQNQLEQHLKRNWSSNETRQEVDNIMREKWILDAHKRIQDLEFKWNPNQLMNQDGGFKEKPEQFKRELDKKPENIRNKKEQSRDRKPPIDEMRNKFKEDKLDLPKKLQTNEDNNQAVIRKKEINQIQNNEKPIPQIPNNKRAEIINRNKEFNDINHNLNENNKKFNNEKRKVNNTNENPNKLWPQSRKAKPMERNQIKNNPPNNNQEWRRPWPAPRR